MKLLFSILTVFVLSGCAAIFSGGRQTVAVLTPEVEGATCSLSDSAGRVWYIESTPGTALVKRGDGPITVICQKDGYTKGSGMIKEKIAGSNYANLALGPAAPIGYFVDGFTGSGQMYESSIEIEMEKMAEEKKTSSWKDKYR